MGLFGKPYTSKRYGKKHSRIDPATGRNKRDKSTVRRSGMIRQNGRVVDRAAQRRSRKTGRPVQRKGWSW